MGGRVSRGERLPSQNKQPYLSLTKALPPPNSLPRRTINLLAAAAGFTIFERHYSSSLYGLMEFVSGLLPGGKALAQGEVWSWGRRRLYCESRGNATILCIHRQHPSGGMFPHSAFEHPVRGAAWFLPGT